MEYLPIQALDLQPDTKITFDLFFRLPLNEKYFLYRRKGSQVEQETINRLVNFKIKNFFIKKEDYREFVIYVARRLSQLIRMQPSLDRDNVILNMARNMMFNTFESSDPQITKALIENLSHISAHLIENALESTTSNYNKTTFKGILKLASQGTNFQKHPMNVCSFAVFLCIGIGYTNEKIITDLAMAAILHDIGLTRLPVDLIPKAHHSKELNHQQAEEVKKHPVWTIEILSEKEAKISHLTKTIILQHHERFDGQGFPFRLKSFMINELAMLLKFADGLDDIVNSSDSTIPFNLKIKQYLDEEWLTGGISPELLKRIQRVIT